MVQAPINLCPLQSTVEDPDFHEQNAKPVQAIGLVRASLARAVAYAPELIMPVVALNQLSSTRAEQLAAKHGAIELLDEQFPHNANLDLSPVRAKHKLGAEFFCLPRFETGKLEDHPLLLVEGIRCLIGVLYAWIVLILVGHLAAIEVRQETPWVDEAFNQCGKFHRSFYVNSARQSYSLERRTPQRIRSMTCSSVMTFSKSSSLISKKNSSWAE